MAKTQTFLQKCCPQRRCRKIAQCDWNLKVNNPRMDLFNNKISTGIYNPINFVPKSLALQFSRTVNIFFLCVGGLQIIGPISTTDGIPVIFLPLTMIIIFASIKEIIEDLKRHKSDKIENNKKVMIYKDGSFVEDKWENIHVGHIVKVREDEPIPADILLLNTSLKKGVCYIETKNLDGETNLKTKCVHKDIPAWESVEELVNNSDINLKYESPNEYLYKFCGCLKTLDQDIAVNEQNFLLRGSFLRNTPEIIGVVCYTGHLTKIMLNSTNSKSKLSKLERDMGRLIGFLFMILFSFTLFAATYASIWAVSEHDETRWYLDPNGENPNNHNYAYLFPIQIGSWLLLLCGCVPISLLVMVEICRLVQSLLISIDPGMRHIETNVTTSVQSPSLTEELGQIEYILSDKTGTLTKNIMDFKKISIGGELYGNISTQKEMVTYAKVPNVDFWDTNLMEDLSNPNMNNHKAVKECVTLLAVCHTAVVQEKKGEKFYNTTSPDELALVNFAKFVGIEFEGIDEENNMCIIYKKKVLKYKLLQVFEFNSDRKRMSVIVKTPEGKVMLYTKGADTVLLDRMDEEDHDNGYQVMIANAHVQRFATEGLRTLLLAKRELSMPEYLKWAEKYEVAKTTIVNREEEMEKLQSEIEVDLKLVGATGIEDKLQDEVGITIAKFKEAGMKVWMLTGDKVETAISIGYACQLLDTTMTHFVLTEKTHEEVAESIANKLLEVEASDNELTRFSLVISGEALIHAMRPEICQNLIKIAKRCQAVIACRVSPKQKQQFVSLIKKNSPKSSTLAIGDGANDVYMITAASVGVGIRGLEGQQAARAADFAIGEFKLLRRLLFYHGRENYRRNSYLVLYNFYKNIAVVSSYLWFGFFNGFSATPFIDKFLYQCFNTVFTSVPIILFATLDGEFSASKLVNTPALYVQGIKNELFNRKKFAKWVFIGIFESAIVGCYGIFTFDKNFSDDDGGRFIGLYGCGMFLYTGIVYIVNLKIIAMCNSFNFLVLFFVALSIIVFNMCFLAGTQVKGITVYGFLYSMAANVNFYIGICVVAVATYTPALVHRSFYYLDQLCPPAPVIKIKANKEFKRIFPAEKEILNLVDLTKDEETPHAHVHTHPLKFPLQMLRGNSDTTSMFSEMQSP